MNYKLKVDVKRIKGATRTYRKTIVDVQVEAKETAASELYVAAIHYKLTNELKTFNPGEKKRLTRQSQPIIFKK